MAGEAPLTGRAMGGVRWGSRCGTVGLAAAGAALAEAAGLSGWEIERLAPGCSAAACWTSGSGWVSKRSALKALQRSSRCLVMASTAICQSPASRTTTSATWARQQGQTHTLARST